DTYRDRSCTFNDDIQGTGAITLAAAISAVRVCGTPLRNQRVVIFGAGAAGLGTAAQIRDAMVREGLSKEDAASRFWCVDRQGLLTTGMAVPPRDYQVDYARPAAESKSWQHAGHAPGVGLAAVVRRVPPTVLLGAFPPNTNNGRTYVIAQVKKPMRDPGLPPTASPPRATKTSDTMFTAAARA